MDKLLEFAQACEMECRNCEHWISSTPNPRGYRKCCKAVHLMNQPLYSDKPPMIYWGIGKADAGFMTYEDFGCILFEEREVPVVKE